MTHPSSKRNEPGAALGPVLEALNRRKWLALVVFASVSGSVVGLALSLPDLYRASATVLVERQQVSELFVTPSVTAELETRILTIEQQVMSRARLTELVATFNLYPEARKKAPLDAVVDRMRRDIRLSLKGAEQQMTGRNATISFAISYGGRDPRTVAMVANALARSYVDENTKIREGQATQTADFLGAQLAETKAQLDAQEARASAFKLGHMGELPQQVEANLASLERLNTQLRLNGENQIRAMDRRERFDKQLADAELAAPSVAATASARTEQLAKLRRQLNEQQSHFTAAYPDVVRLRHEIATLEQRVADDAQEGTATAPIDPRPRLKQSIADTESELRALKDEELALRHAVAGYEQRVENVPKRQEEFQELSRDYDTTKERYNTLLKRYEDAQLAASLEQGRKVEQFRILDAAMPPADPSAPNRLRLLVMGFLAAVALAGGAALAAEKLNTAFHSIDDLRLFVGSSMVIRVPLILTAADKRRQRRRLALGAISSVVAIVLLVAASHYIASGNEQIVRLIERGNN